GNLRGRRLVRLAVGTGTLAAIEAPDGAVDAAHRTEHRFEGVPRDARDLGEGLALGLRGRNPEQTLRGIDADGKDAIAFARVAELSAHCPFSAESTWTISTEARRPCKERTAA